MQILFEDYELVVCVKPRGVASEGDGDGDMPRLLSRYREEKGEVGEVYPVHRLDKETAGVMVYAKTREAAARLSEGIQNKTVKKEYLAVTSGIPDLPSATLTDLLYRDSKKNKSYVVKRMRRGVREARLSYRTVSAIDGRALLYVLLDTGRTHQIRVQMSHRGLSLVGDRRYGGVPAPTLALFAFRLSFLHPKDKRPLSFAALPEGEDAFLPFASAIRALLTDESK